MDKPVLMHLDTKYIGEAAHKPKLRVGSFPSDDRVEKLMAAALGARGDPQKPKPGDTLWVYDGGRQSVESQPNSFFMPDGSIAPSNEAKVKAASALFG